MSDDTSSTEHPPDESSGPEGTAPIEVPTPMPAAVDGESVRDLTAQIREWRRGRSERSFSEAFQDAYVAIFSTIVIAAMAISALDSVRDLTDVACSQTCVGVRSTIPLLAVLGISTLTLSLARLLGPIFVPPAWSHWLLSTPLSRADLLRRALVRAWLVAVLGASLLVVAPAVVGASDAEHGVAAALLACVAALAVVAWAALDQIRGGSSIRRLGIALSTVLWALVLVIALRPEQIPTGGPATGWWWAATGVFAAAAVTGMVVAIRALGSATRAALAPTAQAWPSLSGALASFDLTLLFDVLQSRRWAAVGWVRSRRGGPSGWWALPHAELRRMRRNPRPWLVLAAVFVVPFALVRAGTEHGAAVGVALVGFLVGPPLASGLRVVVRTPTLARIYLFESWQVRAAHALLPGVGLLLLGVVTGVALGPDLAAGPALHLGVAAGLSGLAATVRWVCATPPDYAAPLLSTPAGGLPPGMLMGFAKGLDVWLLTSLPLLLGSTWWSVSTGISMLVIAWNLSAARPVSKQ